MHRKVAGEFLHDISAINAIKIAGSDIVARVRYHTEDILSCEQVFTFVFQSPNYSILLLGRSRYVEIANVSEDKYGKEDVVMVAEDGTVSHIILHA